MHTFVLLFIQISVWESAYGKSAYGKFRKESIDISLLWRNALVIEPEDRFMMVTPIFSSDNNLSLSELPPKEL
jgi:hypothetical protein